MPEALTQARIDALAFCGKRQSIRDATVRGLMVRVAQGGCTYALQREKQGKTCLVTLGSTETFSLAEARKWARAQHVLFDKGIDPTVRLPSTPTVPTLGNAWQLRLAHLRHRRQPATVENYEHFWRYFTDWADKPIDQITRVMLKKRHSDMGDRPVLANRALKSFRETWNFVDSHLTEIGACPLPKKDFFYQEKRKPKGMDAAQLLAWGEAIQKQPRRDMLLFALLSGLRRRTLLALDWEWIGWQSIEIPGAYMKSGRDFRLPLSAQMQWVLDRLHHGAPCPEAGRIFPFAGHRSKSVAYGHTLRHTYRTMGAAAGVPTAFLDALLDHKAMNLGSVYQNDAALFDELLKQQQVISDHIGRIVEL